ncbi:MAG: polyhydroxyalkanoic acid system family protein [Bdellovibrionaceae bacterium]|nr:polyhydroxyalkanoic acid system family protein [Pseudobdellovibrionaceae bacterium]
MPQVKIEKDFSLKPDDVLKQIETLLRNSKDLKQVEPNLQVDVNNGNRTITAQGKKLSGSVKVQESGSGCHIVLELDLPWTLAPFKSLVQSKLEANLDKIC